MKAIGAGATTFGVLLALYGPPLRHWWRAPLLSLEYDPKRNAPHWDRIQLDGRAFFLRLRVRNARKCRSAEDVQVLVAAYQGGDIGLEGRALEWSGQRERSGTPVTVLRVPPGLQRHVDLIQITPQREWAVQTHDDQTTGSASGPETMHARLCVHPKPWGGGHLLSTGDHDIVVTITAANADSMSYRMTVCYDGSLSASLISGPHRVNRRSPATMAKLGFKLVLTGFRPSRI